MASKEKKMGKVTGDSARAESFGSAPPTISLSKGKMATFGHKHGDGVWPAAPISVDQKTGFPKDYDKK